MKNCGPGYKDDFVKQYIDIRKRIIQYSDYDKEVISFFRRGIIKTLNYIEESTGNRIDIDFYLNEYFLN